MFLNSNGRVSSNNPLDSRNLLTAGRTAYNPRSPSRHPVAPQILVRRAAARSSMTARITPSSPHSGETRYHSTGPISTRSTTDLEPEPDRSRGGTGPISAKSPGGPDEIGPHPGLAHWVPPARFERATPALGERCSIPELRGPAPNLTARSTLPMTRELCTTTGSRPSPPVRHASRGSGCALQESPHAPPYRCARAPP